ncbi:MAG: RNA-binding S4 domain-containing protein [Candidatus Atribacteria bacterium]|nr:RNA-binding S4 domain-containing protein [Candidatus Atribacteria bacterium]
MRIDKFLKLSRIIKRRTEAKKACDNHCITINGKMAKAGDVVKPFDKIIIQFRSRILEIEVCEVPSGNVVSSQASKMYQITKEEKVVIE